MRLNEPKLSLNAHVPFPLTARVKFKEVEHTLKQLWPNVDNELKGQYALLKDTADISVTIINLQMDKKILASYLHELHNVFSLDQLTLKENATNPVDPDLPFAVMFELIRSRLQFIYKNEETFNTIFPTFKDVDSPATFLADIVTDNDLWGYLQEQIEEIEKNPELQFDIEGQLRVLSQTANAYPDIHIDSENGSMSIKKTIDLDALIDYLNSNSESILWNKINIVRDEGLPVTIVLDNFKYYQEHKLALDTLLSNMVGFDKDETLQLMLKSGQEDHWTNVKEKVNEIEAAQTHSTSEENFNQWKEKYHSMLNSETESNQENDVNHTNDTTKTGKSQ